MKYLSTLSTWLLAMLLCAASAAADNISLLVDTNGVIQFTGFWAANSNSINSVVVGGGSGVGTNGVTINQINTISNLLQAGYLATNTATLTTLTNYVAAQLTSYATATAPTITSATLLNPTLTNATALGIFTSTNINAVLNGLSNVITAAYTATNTATLGVLTNYTSAQLTSSLANYVTATTFSGATNALATLTTNYYVAKANFGLGANYVIFTNGFNVIPIVLGSTPVYLYLGGTTNDPIIQFATEAP